MVNSKVDLNKIECLHVICFWERGSFHFPSEGFKSRFPSMSRDSVDSEIKSLGFLTVLPRGGFFTVG